MLPFADESFTAYVANLSAMLVDHPLNQFKEAYRVLQKGCTASFTIWGKKEECLMFTLMNPVFEKHLPEDKFKAMMDERSHFDLFYGKHFNIDQELSNIGFT